MRIAIVLVSFLPFLYYAAKDNSFHFHGRQVSLTEHLLHLVIGLALLVVVTHAVLGNTSIMMIGLLLFLAAGCSTNTFGIAEFPRSNRICTPRSILLC